MLRLRSIELLRLEGFAGHEPIVSPGGGLQPHFLLSSGRPTLPERFPEYYLSHSAHPPSLVEILNNPGGILSMTSPSM